MNLRYERFMAGSATFSRRIVRPGRFHVPVFDRAVWARRAVACMAARGMGKFTIAHKLGRPLAFVSAEIQKYRL